MDFDGLKKILIFEYTKTLKHYTMKDYQLFCYIEDNNGNIVDQLTEYYDFKAINDEDAEIVARGIYEDCSKLPYYGFFEKD